MPRVGAEGDLVVAAAGGEGGHGLAGLGVDHGDAALFPTPGVVADPEVAAVRLQGQAHRLGAGGQVAQYLELGGVHHRHFAGAGHGHVDQPVVGAGHPIHGRALQGDAGQGAGDAADGGHRVDHGERRVLVHHHQVVAVQVHHGAGAEHTLEVGADARLALVGLAFGQCLVEPGPRHLPGQRLAGGGVGEAQADVGEHALGQYPVAPQGPGLELDGHAIAHQAVGRITGWLAGAGLGGQRGEQKQAGSFLEGVHLASPFLNLALGRQQCLCHSGNGNGFSELRSGKGQNPEYSPAVSPLLGERRRLGGVSVRAAHPTVGVPGRVRRAHRLGGPGPTGGHGHL
ncbi:hypothetical protein D9M69_289480 [compost metagenome]